ncbi:uncharacterized protein DUF5047 [Haloactinopolyspora alba]|uniref:Uncharacterized protein DUF5047 n=1 Tax=Haloactinopolyspora alba TaxID=648780 RepID=A0A2P8D052_9ACTN|nr:DUF5047 domain-containing protein [Haloactinopolyspora alba]PSK90577.1 uncharacterized protein DUF5047 [Haloactinopolyspora alba]
MRPVSDEFLSAVTGTHTMAARARVLTTYQTGSDPDGVEVGIIDGEVSGDATAAIRHELDLTTPARTDDLLTPYGNEIYVERGVSLRSGAVEWVGLGYFRIWEASQDGDSDQPVGIAAKDRMAGIMDARLEAPVQYLASNDLGFVFTDLVQAVYPSALVAFDDSASETLGRNTVVEKDRYAFLRDLAAAYGKVFYVDHTGVFRVETPPDPTVPLLTVAGGRGGVLLELSTELYRDGVYNAVIAEGEGTDDKPPVRAVVRDENPQSPTYYFGTYGKVPRFYSSQFIRLGTQAHRAARSILRQNLGLPYSADLSAVPNPALEVLDPISVRDRDTAQERTYVVKESTIPLTAQGAMTATMTEQVDFIGGDDG